MCIRQQTLSGTVGEFSTISACTALQVIGFLPRNILMFRATWCWTMFYFANLYTGCFFVSRATQPDQ